MSIGIKGNVCNSNRIQLIAHHNSLAVHSVFALNKTPGIRSQSWFYKWECHLPDRFRSMEGRGVFLIGCWAQISTTFCLLTSTNTRSHTDKNTQENIPHKHTLSTRIYVPTTSSNSPKSLTTLTSKLTSTFSQQLQFIVFHTVKKLEAPYSRETKAQKSIFWGACSIHLMQ